MLKSFDKHLNVFWSYNGKPYLEDNITRAFIVTLSFLLKEEQIEFINYFVEPNLLLLEDKDIEIYFDLQNIDIVSDEEIKKANKRFLIGISPTGKVWEEEKYKSIISMNTKEVDENLLEEDNNKYLKKILPKTKEIEELIKDEEELLKIKNIILNKIDRERGNARLDGWILIFKNNKLEIAIGIENKLYDLDPYQLNNHCKKVLNISYEEIKFRTFENVFDKLKKYEDIKIVSHFLEYVERLGYYIKTSKILEEDVLRIEKEDNNLVNRKISKFFEKYFKSKEFEVLKNKYNIEYKKHKRWIIFNKIGFNGIGNIYFDVDINKDKKFLFFIGTEIGVANRWENEKFCNKLKNNKNFKELLNTLYPKNDSVNIISIFQILFRVNQCSYSNPIFIEESKTLNDILNCKLKYEYRNNLSKNQCINILKEILDKNFYDNGLSKRGGENSTATNYNILPYLRFIDYVRQPYILNIDEKEFIKKFNGILEKHLIGLKTIYENI